MADTIKKISAFESLPVKGVTANTEFIVAKENANYKLSFENLYSAIDYYITKTKSGITSWVSANFASKDSVTESISELATKSDIADINTKLSLLSSTDELNELVTSLSKYATKEDIADFITSDDLQEIHDSYLVKSDFDEFVKTVYTKEETQALIDSILADNIDSLVEASKPVTDIKNDIDDIHDDIDGIKEVVDVIKTDGDGNRILGDDGKYHDFSSLSVIDYGEVKVTNDMLDENNLMTATIIMPKLPRQSTITLSVKVGNTSFEQTYARGISVYTEMNRFEKRWFDNRTAFELAFENDVYQFEHDDKISNLVKSKTYFDEDKVADKIMIRSTVIDALHAQYEVPIQIQFTDKIPSNSVIGTTITWRIFGIQ